jgi:membrane fusion protein (multidrug efflux system)
MPALEVGVLEVRPRSLPLALEYAAQLRGVREVEVRARVSGILLERLYKEGARVEAGDLLFRIDPDPFRAEAARARAELGVRQANLEQTRRERDRILPLYDQRLTSLRDRDNAIAAFESAEAAVAAAQAALRTAELDLSYTDVRAPISGLTSREVRSEGSLISADDDSSLLTHIVQADRLYVDFAVSDTEASLISDAVAENPHQVAVRVIDSRGHVLGAEARIEFIAPRVDDETGTVGIRATLDNADGSLLPGRVVRARVEGVTIPNALVIPKRALMHGAQGAFVWVVAEGNAVAPQPVALGAASGNDVVVADGLAPGSRVVVDGVLKVQPGAVVDPVPLADDGAVGAGGAPAGQGQPGPTP